MVVEAIQGSSITLDSDYATTIQFGKTVPYSSNLDETRLVIAAGKTVWAYRFLWKLKIPPTVRVFGYLLLHGRLLTHDVMMHRGLQCNLRCEVCQRCSLETATHLFFQCYKARRCWASLNAMLGCNIVSTGDTVQATVIKSWKACKRRMSRNEWGPYFFAVCWFLWRARHKKIFEDIEPDPIRIAQHAIREAKLWLKYC
ncbi:uncharacterized protein LOC144554459 [Carex rostrata]